MGSGAGGVAEADFCPVPPQATRAASMRRPANVVASSLLRRLRPVQTNPASPNAGEPKPNQRKSGFAESLRKAPTVLAPVLMLIVVVAAEPLTFSDAGAKLHCAFAGRFEHWKLTAP